MLRPSQGWEIARYRSRYAIQIALSPNARQKPDAEMHEIFSNCVGSAQSNVPGVHIHAEDLKSFSLEVDSDEHECVLTFVNHLCDCFTSAENARRKCGYMTPVVFLSLVPGEGDERLTPPDQPGYDLTLVC